MSVEMTGGRQSRFPKPRKRLSDKMAIELARPDRDL